MTLREHIEKTPARAALFALGLCLTLSCVALLGDGLSHLRWLAPLAASNILAGTLASERMARAILALEFTLILAALGLRFFHLHARFPGT